MKCLYCKSDRLEFNEDECIIICKYCCKKIELSMKSIKEWRQFQAHVKAFSE